MQEQLISFETAKLAKEKGIEISSKDFYTDTFGLCHFGDDGEFLYNSEGEHQYDCNGEFEVGERYYAPTQSLLQKWLREVHNIHVYVTPEDIRKENQSYFYHIWGDEIRQHFRGTLGKNYEEALEVGLVEALKLI